LYSEQGLVINAEKQRNMIGQICHYVGGLLREIEGVEYMRGDFSWNTLLVMGEGLSVESDVGQNGTQD